MTVVAGTLVLGVTGDVLGVQASWLIAALVAGGAVALVGGEELTPPKQLLRPAQGLVGVSAAAPLSFVTWPQLRQYLGVSLVCVVLTLVICLGSSALLTRIAPEVRPATAVLSTLAGGASGISTMAPELDVDHRYVALSQYLRLIVVTLTMPALLALAGGSSGSSGAEIGQFGAASVAILAVLVLAVGYAGRRLHLPAPFLLTPLLVTAAIGMAGGADVVPTAPVWLSALSYIVIGWQAGGAFSRSSIRVFVRLLPVTATFIAVALVGCFGLAVLVQHWLAIPLSQAYLATTPGGIYAVLAVAHGSGSSAVVTTMQVVRLLAMLLTAIIAAKLLSRREQRVESTARTQEVTSSSV